MERVPAWARWAFFSGWCWAKKRRLRGVGGMANIELDALVKASLETEILKAFKAAPDSVHQSSPAFT